MIRSILDGLLRLILDKDAVVSYRSASARVSPFAVGRSALVSISNKETGAKEIGTVGEISPEILEKYGMKVPAVGFEINLETILKE